MNAIVNGFQDKKIFEVIKRLAKLLPLRYAAIIYDREQYKLSIKQDFFNWEDLVWSATYNVDWQSIAPLDEDIIEQMSSCETVVLKMMDRFETRKSYSYQERKDLYLKHLRFWNDYIDKKKIDLFISSNIPHEVFDYVIYCLCKIKGIPTVFMYQSHMPDTIIVMNDWEKSSEILQNSYPRLLKDFDQVGAKEIELPSNFESYFKRHTSQGEDTTPFYMKRISAKDSLLNLIKSFSNRAHDNLPNNLQVTKNIFRGFISNGPEKKLFSFYESKCQPFDKNEKYIYVPLHYQPELTTSPCAGVFVNQLVLVQLLASCLPEDYLIYVKEHPKQKVLGRNRGFYEELLSIKSVRLISRKTDFKALITHSAAVTTCIGTAGWEALFEGKQVIMFGHDFYQYAPGVFSVKTAEDCRSALRKIVAGEEKPTHFTLRVFLKALSQVIVNGYIDPVYRQETGLTENENVSNIADGLNEYIKNNQ